MPSTTHIPPTTLCHALLNLLGRRLHRLSLESDDGTPFVRREPPQLLRFRSIEEVAAQLRATAEAIRAQSPYSRRRLAGFESLIQRVLNARTPAEFESILNACQGFLGGSGDPAPLPSGFVFTHHAGGAKAHADGAIRVNPELERLLQREQNDQRFLAEVMTLLAARRSEGLSPEAWSIHDLLAVEHASQLLDRGVQLPRNHHPILTDPDRPFQTYLSFADPGDGHLSTTVVDDTLLEGLIVHVEHIDRDGVDDTDQVEAYRLPALRNAARVRLHVGDATPVTCYVGRPVFESGSFARDLLKSAHLTAAVCSALFSQGVADCKVAMDGMTSREAVEFMRVVAGNVIRDLGTQRLSAAFNINRPLTDDARRHGGTQVLTNAAEIAARAIELVFEGRFDKIAWDGASKQQPSQPIIGQLSPAVLLDLVHDAHQRGLETYISAGMTAEHMRLATLVGVGGVGIGTSLHHRADVKTHLIGEIDPERVRHALAVRDRAATEVAGQAAATLAQLDWRYAEGSLPKAANPLRIALHAGLRSWLERDLATFGSGSGDSQSAELGATLEQIRDAGVLDEAGEVEAPASARWEPEREQEAGPINALGGDGSGGGGGRGRVTRRPSHPLLRRARRILAARRCREGVACPPEQERRDLDRLEALLAAGDSAGVGEYLARS